MASGISLVRHRTALLAEAELGNRLLLDEVAGDPGFVPMAVLSLDRTEDVDRAGAARRLGRPGSGSRARHARAAACRPSPSSGPRPRTGRPLFVPIKGWGSSAAIGAATEGLGVPVILTGSHYTTSVEDLAAGRPLRAPPLRHELDGPLPGDRDGRRRRSAPSACCSAAVRRSGPSSRRSTRSSSPTIPDDAKRAILAGNAARLFGLADARVDAARHRPAAPRVSTSTPTAARCRGTCRI